MDARNRQSAGKWTGAAIYWQQGTGDMGYGIWNMENGGMGYLVWEVEDEFDGPDGGFMGGAIFQAKKNQH